MRGKGEKLGKQMVFSTIKTSAVETIENGNKTFSEGPWRGEEKRGGEKDEERNQEFEFRR